MDCVYRSSRLWKGPFFRKIIRRDYGKHVKDIVRHKILKSVKKSETSTDRNTFSNEWRQKDGQEDTIQ